MYRLATNGEKADGHQSGLQFETDADHGYSRQRSVAIPYVRSTIGYHTAHELLVAIVPDTHEGSVGMRRGFLSQRQICRIDRCACCGAVGARWRAALFFTLSELGHLRDSAEMTCVRGGPSSSVRLT